MEVQPGQGRGGGGLEPVLAGVVRALGLHHVEGVGVPRLGARVTLGLVVHLLIVANCRNAFRIFVFNQIEHVDKCK